jgi:hypothetical protein
MIAPAHAGAALDDIDDAFEGAVMVRAGLGVGVDGELIAAARDIPGVCGVLVSRSLPLTTRTPLVRQSCLLSVISASVPERRYLRPPSSSIAIN